MKDTESLEKATEGLVQQAFSGELVKSVDGYWETEDNLSIAAERAASYGRE